MESPESTQRRPYPSVSIVTPVYNEESVVDLLLKELEAVMGDLPSGLEHEVVIVDDGSTDGTSVRLKAATASRPYLRVVRLSRNFGHQAAVTAGIDHARADVVFVIDGDLQDDPHVLPVFIDAYRDGADVVYARRVRRKESLGLRLAYAIHYRLLASMSSIDLPVDAGDFGLLSRQVVDVLKKMPERQRYIRGLRAWAGFKQVGIEVERRPRAGGDSKYSLGKLLRLASDGILAFSVIPLRISIFLGLLGLLAGAVLGIWVLAARLFTGAVPQGFTMLALLQIGFSGLILLMLGVVGEYVGRIYEEVKGRPTYVVAELDEVADG